MKRKLLIFSIALLIFSCSKDKEPDWVAINTQLLTAGVWEFSDYDYRNTISHTTFADLPACRQDDQELFLAGGGGEVNEGPTKCSSSAPQSTALNWSFTDHYAHVLMISSVEYYVDKLDAHEFRYHKKTLDPYAPEISYGYTR